MRHPSLRRLAAALLNLLFLLAWGEPVTLHPCPTHDAPAFAGVTAVSAPAFAGVAGAAAHHGHQAAMPAAEHRGHAEHEGSHLCSCLGSCALGVAVAAPTAQAVRWQVVVRRRVAPIEPAADAPLAAAPRLLPFANGPPGAA